MSRLALRFVVGIFAVIILISGVYLIYNYLFWEACSFTKNRTDRTSVTYKCGLKYNNLENKYNIYIGKINNITQHQSTVYANVSFGFGSVEYPLGKIGYDSIVISHFDSEVELTSEINTADTEEEILLNENSLNELKNKLKGKYVEFILYTGQAARTRLGVISEALENQQLNDNRRQTLINNQNYWKKCPAELDDFLANLDHPSAVIGYTLHTLQTQFNVEYSSCIPKIGTFTLLN